VAGALQREAALSSPREKAPMTLTPAFRATIRGELERLVEEGLPGAFVYLEEADGASAFETAGAADLATREPMTADSFYHICSTTKTFTAVVVMQLIGEGRLALSDLVQSHMPDRSIPNGDRLTIEHLLRMRSGLFDFEDDPSLLGNLEAHLRPVPLADVIDFALRGPTSFEPGERFAYCNSNFVLLEAIVERLTGRSLGEEMRDRIFEPAGLTATSYPDENDLTIPDPYIRLRPGRRGVVRLHLRDVRPRRRRDHLDPARHGAITAGVVDRPDAAGAGAPRVDDVHRRRRPARRAFTARRPGAG
jgi:D-alanyl-D-alanine carboxypeptidase